MLLLADGSHVLWIMGHRISDNYKVTNATKRILVAEIKGEKSNGRQYQSIVNGGEKSIPGFKNWVSRLVRIMPEKTYI